MSEQSTSTEKEKKKKWYLDRSAVSTVAVVVINLCALIVSIYQTRLLSLPQQVMVEQQEIMIDWLKAELILTDQYRLETVSQRIVWPFSTKHHHTLRFLIPHYPRPEGVGGGGVTVERHPAFPL